MKPAYRLFIALMLLTTAAVAQNLSPFAPPPFATDPAACYTSQIYFNTGANSIKLCTATNVFRPIVDGPTAATTALNFPRWNTTTGDQLGTGLPGVFTGNGSVDSVVMVAGANNDLLDVSLMPAYFPETVANDGTTGTTLNSLAKITSTGTAIRIATTDTALPIFIVTAGAGTSGSATLAKIGKATCQFDAGAGTIAHFVVASTTTAGRCADAGASPPATGWVIGQLLTTAAANGTATVDLDAGYYSATGGGSVTSLGFTSPVNGFTFTSSTTNPVTSTGTFTLGFANEAAGVAFIGPCTGSAATPGWRALCYQDIPGATPNNPGFSATPNFDLSLAGVQTLTLTGNVTGATVSNGSAGKLYVFTLCQDGTGGRTFTWPSGFHGQMTIGSSASVCSSQAFEAQTSSTFYAVAPGVINQ